MVFHKQSRILYNTIPWLLILLPLSTACHKSDPDEGTIRNVCIVYSAGFNNLCRYMASDLDDLSEEGYVPKKNDPDILLVISRLATSAADDAYKKPAAAYLYRLSKQKNKVVRDTLFSLREGVSLSEPDAMHTMLCKAMDLFPAERYGMVFSSHGSGWLPAGFYYHPEHFSNTSAYRRARRIIASDYPHEGTLADVPMTKSAGVEFYFEPGCDDRLSMEMDIGEMADAIPMHLDYLLFDACLMGGVEVAWAFRKTADYVGFSQAEILAEGFNYTTIAAHLLKETPNLVAVCNDFYQQYEKKEGYSHSATVSLIQTESLYDLARACRPLFEQYRTQISTLESSGVQCFGGGKPYFYDLVDILEKAGIPDLSAIQAALDKCVVYKGTTGQYYTNSVIGGGTFPVNAFCGLSMYLPSSSAVSTGKAYLDAYYRTLGWNKATGLVK